MTMSLLHADPERLHYGPVTVLGQLGSKSNQRQLVTFGGRPALIKSAKARAWEKGFLEQVPTPPHGEPVFLGPVVLVARCYYEDRRRDLDTALLCDCIQKAGVLKNDRQIEEIHAYRYVDKFRPRVEFELWERAV